MGWDETRAVGSGLRAKVGGEVGVKMFNCSVVSSRQHVAHTSLRNCHQARQ